jgi:SpoVK/Ycf46/Vps4 family AAA+-type ATPase
MTLADDVNLEEFVMTKDEFSGADIKAICTEAGLLALRERRMKVRNLFMFLLLYSIILLFVVTKLLLLTSSV